MEYYSVTVESINKDADKKALFSIISLLWSMLVITCLNAFGVFILGHKMTVLMSIAALVQVVNLVCMLTLPGKIKRIVYVVINCIFISLIYSGLSYHVVVMLIYPVICSTLFTDRYLYWISVIINTLCILVGHIIAIDVTCVFDDPLKTITASVLFGFVPRFLELLTLYVVVGYIYYRQLKSMDYLYVINDALARDQEYLVFALSRVTSNFSDETGEHIHRVADYSEILFRELGYSNNRIHDCKLAAMLHDFGKILIPLNILNKPEKLTKYEIEIMKKHTIFGKELLSGTDSTILCLGAVIAYEHHENYDGTGYHGLKGDEIDEVSQCVALADVFDALTSVRAYKEAWDFDTVMKYINNNSGKKFSPKVVNAFILNSEKFRRLYNKFNQK